MSAAGEDQLARSLRQIEELVARLDALPDRAAREPARALLELVLDLHALALARMVAAVASAEGGTALLERMAEDEQIRAVLLLHGLHPEEMAVRVRKAVDRLHPQLAERGLGLELIEVTANRARLRVRRSSARAMRVDAAMLGQEIEAAIVDAAPDLETIVIDGLDATEPQEIAAAAD